MEAMELMVESMVMGASATMVESVVTVDEGMPMVVSRLLR